MRKWSQRSLALVAVVGSVACEGGAEPDTLALATRDTLPSGRVVVSYASLPDSAWVIEPDLRIGEVEGEPEYIFGNVRSIEADGDGAIYVMDYQASDVRVFDSEGQFLRTFTSKGEGPGEITESNGMQFVGDSVLWIQDYGRWTMLGLGLDGEEVARVPMHVRSYGYTWSGSIDREGRFWKPTSHSDTERVFPPEEGLTEGVTRGYMNVFDPRSETTDSVYLGERRYRTFISQTEGGGYRYRGIPFDPGVQSVISPEGLPWLAGGTGFSISRLNPSGDTTLTIEADVDPLPITASERAAYVDAATSQLPGSRSANEQIAELMPDFKPVVGGLVFDDQGRLWVQRTPADEFESRRYDIFDADGFFRGAVRLGFEAAPYLPIRVRGDHLYAVVTDELDVPFVVRAPLPEALRR